MTSGILQFGYNPITGLTSFIQGALGGGGFVTDISMSSNGNTRLLTTDVVAFYNWNPTTSKWVNRGVNPALPPAFNSQAVGAWAQAFAPSNPLIVYTIITNFDSAQQGLGALCKSTNGGGTYTDTGIRVGVIGFWERFCGPRLIVDPVNENVVYWSNSAGLVFRSIDGCATIYDGGTFISSLATAIPSGTATGPSVGNAIPFAGGTTPAGLLNYLSYNTNQSPCGYNATNPATVANIDPEVNISALTSSSVSLGGAPASSTGDLWYFGTSIALCFDPTSGTTTLGGQTATKGIYFGWHFGASHLWSSTDGGTTFSAMSGGPATVSRLVCSSDGVVYVCGADATGPNAGVLTGMWRYITPTSTNSLSLASGWTNFAIQCGAQNLFTAVAADPLNQGHVACAVNTPDVRYAPDYGQNWVVCSSSYYRTETGSDCLWLVNTGNAMNTGNLCFDPLVNNKLWLASGDGVFYCDPTAITTTVPAVWASHSLDNNELIMYDIVKAPSGPILFGVGDRHAFVVPDANTPPVNMVPYTAVFTGYIDDGTGSHAPGNLLTVTAMQTGPIVAGIQPNLVGSGVPNSAWVNIRESITPLQHRSA